MNRRSFLKTMALAIGALVFGRLPKNGDGLPDDIIVALYGVAPYTIHWCTGRDFRGGGVPEWHPMTPAQWERFNEKRYLEHWRKSRLLQYGWK